MRAPGDEAENAPAAARRKKGAAGVRTWLAVDAAGQTQVVEAGKHSIMRRTGLPARDLRILDPLLSYPSTVLGRERAVVVNLDRIKAIVTAHEVLLLNFQDPLVAPFVRDLQHRLHLRRIASYSSPGATIEQEFNLGRGGADWASPIEANLPHSGSGSESPPLGYPAEICGLTEVDNAEDAIGTNGSSNSVGQKALPFEFIALETCLEAACSRLEKETITLEQEAHPALDKLTSKISTLNLEHVRQIKSCLVAMIGRVQKVRDELEHLLDDDEDMAEMYLTEKQEQCDSSVSSSNRGLGDGGVSPHALSEANNCEEKFEQVENDEILLSGSDADGTDSRTHASSLHSGSKRLDVEELEMLLEAYFVQVEGTLNKLSALREYVDDTEDYINIMLDDKQNQLLQMEVMLTTAALVVSLFVVLLGVFGMNIQIDPYDESKSGMTEFLWTAGGGASGTILLYVVIIAWCKQKRLLE